MLIVAPFWLWVPSAGILPGDLAGRNVVRRLGAFLEHGEPGGFRLRVGLGLGELDQLGYRDERPGLLLVESREDGVGATSQGDHQYDHEHDRPRPPRPLRRWLVSGDGADAGRRRAAGIAHLRALPRRRTRRRHHLRGCLRERRGRPRRSGHGLAALHQAKVVEEPLCGQIAIGGPFLQGPHDDRVQVLADVVVDAPRRCGQVVDVLHGYAHRVVAVERQPPRCHLVHNDAERIEVGGRLDRLALGLFRREVVRRADDRPRLGHGGRASGPGDAEVGDLHRPSLSTMMFCGLMSRWMTSCRCANLSASRIWMEIETISSGLSGACLTISSLSDRPSRYSMAM